MKNIIIYLLIATFFIVFAPIASARSGCCSWHGGVRADGCGCNDGSSLSSTCAPYYVCTRPQQINLNTNDVTSTAPTPTATITPSPRPTITPKPKPSKAPINKNKSLKKHTKSKHIPLKNWWQKTLGL